MLRLRHLQETLAFATMDFPHKTSFFVNYSDLLRMRSGPAFCDLLESRPDVAMSHIRDAVGRFMDPEVRRNLSKMTVRVYHLPRKIPIRKLRTKDVGKLVAVEGVVRRVTEVKPKLSNAVFRCAAPNCGRITNIPQTTERLSEPHVPCRGDGRETHRAWELDTKRSEYIDYQHITLQEFNEGLKASEQPYSLDIEITGDITGEVTAGSRVTFNGVVENLVARPSRTHFDTMFQANSFEKQQTDYDEIHITDDEVRQFQEWAKGPVMKMIRESVSPAIYGHDLVKLAIVLQLFGGVTRSLPDTTRVRGDIHILLVGDPGTAKSQLLKFVVKLSPRGIFTMGKQASAAGLTASAVQDEHGRWVLEAGAMVLADGGIVCIDEFDKMSESDRSGIHGAMEQQEVDFAKAGLVASLKARCSVLAAANPKTSRFDPYEPVAEQINLPPSLLSRFDLIFIIQDKPSKALDSEIARHVLTVRRKDKESTPPMSPEMLRKYVAYSKRTFSPELDDSARQVIESYWIGVREKAKSTSSVPITVRKLEDLVRLTEAAARARLSSVATASDAELAVQVVDECLIEVAYDRDTGTFDVDRVDGVSKSQRDRISVVKRLIRENADGEGWIRERDLLNASTHIMESESFYNALEAMSLNNLIIRRGDKVKLL